jgi:hypothetical protein
VNPLRGVRLVFDGSRYRDSALTLSSTVTTRERREVTARIESFGSRSGLSFVRFLVDRFCAGHRNAASEVARFRPERAVAVVLLVALQTGRTAAQFPDPASTLSALPFVVHCAGSRDPPFLEGPTEASRLTCWLQT